MEWFYTADWKKIFVPEMTLPEILAWATLLYLALIVLLRVVPKREFGNTSVSDILFVVLVGGVTTEALGKHGGAVIDFVLILALVMLLNYCVEWLVYHVPFIRRLMADEPAPLIRDGQVLKANLRKEMIAEEELEAQLRQHEIEDPGEVKQAVLESGGEVTVIKKKGGEPQNEPVQNEGRRPHLAEPGLNGHFVSAQLNGQDHPAPEEDEDTAELDPAVQEFLTAAERVQAVLTRHQEQAAEHQAKAAELRRLLADHGIRVPAKRKATAE